MTDLTTPRRGSQRLQQFLTDPRRALWTLALPIVIGMSIQTAYSIVDMIFVGRVSATALTALAFNMPLLFLAMGTTFGLGSGVTALIAQAIGSDDDERADRSAQHALLLGFALTALFTGLGLAAGKPMLRALGVPAEMMTPAWDYFRILASGFVFMVMSVFFRSMLSGEGEVRIPVMIQAGGTLLNIVLDPIFIFTLGLGIRGAALATVVAQAVAATAFVWLLFVRKRSHVRLSLRGFRFDPEVVLGIVRIGLPASLSFVVMALGGASFNRILVEYTPDAVAAHQVGMRLDHLVILPMVAIAAALVTLVGMFFGAGRYDLLEEAVRYAIRRAMLLGVAISALFLAFAPWLVAVFTDDAEIRALAVKYVRTLALAYPFVPIAMLTGRALQGLGRGTPELVLTLLRVLLIALPLAMVAAFVLRWPVIWVWRSMVLASWSSAAIAWFWLRVGLEDARQRIARREQTAMPIATAAGEAAL